MKMRKKGGKEKSVYKKLILITMVTTVCGKNGAFIIFPALILSLISGLPFTPSFLFSFELFSSAWVLHEQSYTRINLNTNTAYQRSNNSISDCRRSVGYLFIYSCIPFQYIFSSLISLFAYFTLFYCVFLREILQLSGKIFFFIVFPQIILVFHTG